MREAPIGSAAGTNANTNTIMTTNTIRGTYGHNTTYAIAVLRNVYRPDIQGERTVRFVHDDETRKDDYTAYESIEAAQEAIDDMESGTYHTSNNEAGAPKYVIVDSSVADYLTTGRGGDMSSYNWDDCDCETKDEDGNACGECSACIDMMIDQDIEYIHRNAVNAA